MELAEEKGVGVSDEDAQALLDQVVQQKVADATATFTEPSLAVARYSIAYSNLQDLPDAGRRSPRRSTPGCARSTSRSTRGSARWRTATRSRAPAPVPWIVAGSAPPTTAAPSRRPTPAPTPTAK